MLDFLKCQAECTPVWPELLFWKLYLKERIFQELKVAIVNIITCHISGFGI